MIEDWIDALAKVWEIDIGFGTVRSYRLFEKAEFPDAIDPSTLDRSPVALTIPASLGPEYSQGGPLIGYWRGVTEFHVAPDLDRGRIPALMLWYGRILRAAAGSARLGGTVASVELFLIENQADSILGPLALQYGDETAHWGFTVNWTVKERLEGQVTVSA